MASIELPNNLVDRARSFVADFKANNPLWNEDAGVPAMILAGEMSELKNLDDQSDLGRFLDGLVHVSAETTLEEFYSDVEELRVFLSERWRMPPDHLNNVYLIKTTWRGPGIGYSEVWIYFAHYDDEEDYQTVLQKAMESKGITKDPTGDARWRRNTLRAGLPARVDFGEALRNDDPSAKAVMVWVEEEGFIWFVVNEFGPQWVTNVVLRIQQNYQVQEMQRFVGGIERRKRAERWFRDKPQPRREESSKCTLM